MIVMPLSPGAVTRLRIPLLRHGAVFDCAGRWRVATPVESALLIAAPLIHDPASVSPGERVRAVPASNGVDVEVDLPATALDRLWMAVPMYNLRGCPVGVRVFPLRSEAPAPSYDHLATREYMATGGGECVFPAHIPVLRGWHPSLQFRRGTATWEPGGLLKLSYEPPPGARYIPLTAFAVHPECPDDYKLAVYALQEDNPADLVAYNLQLLKHHGFGRALTALGPLADSIARSLNAVELARLDGMFEVS